LCIGDNHGTVLEVSLIILPDLIVDDNTIQVWCKHNNRAITSIKGKCMIIPSSFNQNTTTKAMFRLTYNHKYYFY